MPICRSPNVLFPPFKQRLEHGVKLARQAGLLVYIFETWRTNRRQGDLYAIGRTTKGENVTAERPMGQIVTRSRPGESWHEYGVAADLVFDADPDKPGAQWTWVGDYKRVDRIMRAVGLETVPGDSPHWQLTGGMSIGEAERLLESDGLVAVWLEIEARMIRAGIKI